MSDAVKSPCEVWFYHLERSSVFSVLPELLERTLARGLRALVISGGDDCLEKLDEAMWGGPEDSFLAHGRWDAPHAARQPILLARSPFTGETSPNGANLVFLIDQAVAPTLYAYDRLVLLFDGQDEAALARARADWKAFKAAGHPVSYWKQGAERGWQKM